MSEKRRTWLELYSKLCKVKDRLSDPPADDADARNLLDHYRAVSAAEARAWREYQASKRDALRAIVEVFRAEEPWPDALVVERIREILQDAGEL